MTKKTTHPDDAQLFRTTVGPVKTIETNTVILTPDKKPRPTPLFKALEAIDPLQKNVHEQLDILFQEDSVAFVSPGLQKNIIKKLRKGYFGVDANIDLHGLSSRDAQQQLLGFIHSCIEDGCRCVQIIHGKGYNSPNKQPVLKNDINLWLRQHKDVLAFCSTPPKAGGAGALFALLRQSEKYVSNDDVE